MTATREPSSFRDPDGFVFFEDGLPFRVVKSSFQEDFDAIKTSGLWQSLQGQGDLIDHEEVRFSEAEFPGAIAVLKPEKVPFISYPYEWGFSQLKDAALQTLKVQRKSIALGMSLKDASAFNVQFVDGKPVHIDSLSFEIYREGDPWQAYGQFCRHFLAPLALAAAGHIDSQRLSMAFIDGIPLDLAVSLIPLHKRLKPGLMIHLQAHAKSLASASAGASSGQKGKVSKVGMLGLIDSLRGTIASLQLRRERTKWSDYYTDTNYSKRAMESKCELVGQMLDQIQPKTVWDIGANTGEFSKLASDRGASVIAWDMDAACVHRHYEHLKLEKSVKILPLVNDICAPSPAIGWNLAERKSFFDRADADTVMALALVHHLAITNNVPLPMISETFSRLAPNLIIEFVPKSDSQVQRMLSSREDIFYKYNEEEFEAAFGKEFELIQSVPVADSKRTLYHFRRRE